MKRIIIVAGVFAALCMSTGCRTYSGGDKNPDPWRSVGPIPLPPETEAPPETVGAALSVEQMVELEQTLQVGKNQAVRCYEDELERRGNKNLAGSVMLKIQIGSGGSALKIDVADVSTLKVQAVYDCVVEAAMGWEYPKHDRTYWHTTTFNLDPAY